MSHFAALSRLTVAERRSDMLRWALRTPVTALLALIFGIGLAAPTAAQVSTQPDDVTVYTMSPGRIAASFAAVSGLVGAIIGGLAFARSGRRSGFGDGRRAATIALVLAPIGVVIGGVVVATADGGLGTGHGFGGGIVAMTVGLIGMTLGAVALNRSRRDSVRQ
jgi:hypothetical protein